MRQSVITMLPPSGVFPRTPCSRVGGVRHCTTDFSSQLPARLCAAIIQLLMYRSLISTAALMRRRKFGQKASSLPPPPGYGAIICAGVQGLVGGAPLQSKEFDHWQRFGARRRRGGPPPPSGTEYTAERRAILDAELLRAFLVWRAIRDQTPKARITVHKNKEKAWAARFRHSPCRRVSGSG